MLALSIRQPFAELILRGLKTVEYRSRPTRIVGERFWIYAARGSGTRSQGFVTKADNIVAPTESPPPWMIELANALKLFPHELPTGMIVGTAVIEQCASIHPSSFIRHPFRYEWHLRDVKRLARPRIPRRHPQPVWFNPF